MADRFLLAAVVDRLVFGAETTFEAADARKLAQLLPRGARADLLGRFLHLDPTAGLSGGSTRGHAAGVGDVDIRGDKPRTIRLSTENRGVIRAGQWKLGWAGRHIEIDRVADTSPMARSDRLVFNRDGTPHALVQVVTGNSGRLCLASTGRGRS